MSYIRCTSNPEGLYIWGDISGDVCITSSNSNDIKHVPQNVWDKLFVRVEKDDWDSDNNDEEYIEVDGFKVREVIPDCSAFLEAIKNGTDFNKEDHKDIQMIMSYNGWEIKMFPVTFWVIQANATYSAPNPPPWKVLTGIWLFNKIFDWLSWRLYHKFSRH